MGVYCGVSVMKADIPFIISKVKDCFNSLFSGPYLNEGDNHYFYLNQFISNG